MKLKLPKLHVCPAFFTLLIWITISGLKEVDGVASTGSNSATKSRRNQTRNSTNAVSSEIFMVSEASSRQEILVDVGETVYISCPLNKTNVYGCEWYKKSQHGGNRKRITQFFDRYQKITPCQLQIRSVTYEDAGTIICKIITDSTEPAIHSSQLTVTGEGDPSINTLPKPSTSDSWKGSVVYSEPEIDKDLFSVDYVYRVHKGGNVLVKCEATGNPKPVVSWRRGSKIYTSPNEGYSMLKLTNLTEDDTGVYKCEALNLFGKAVQEINIQVRGAFQGSSEIIDITPRNVTLYEGSQGNVTCIARFEGDPWFVWVKKIENKTGDMNTFSYEGHDYAVLPRTDIRPLGQQLYATTLLLQNVTLSYTGIYHCIVAGLQGYNHSEAYVIVEKDPSKLHMAQIRRHKVVAILWIFSFIIFAALVILCILRVYGCPTANSRKLSSQGSLPSQSSSKKTELPKRSPETMSTDCTQRHEVFHPLVTHGSCSLASQEPSVHFKDYISSCGTYNSYDPEYSLVDTSVAEEESFMIADLEAVRSSYSRAGSYCDSEFCCKQSATSPGTQTSDYYTRQQCKNYLQNDCLPNHQHKHVHHHLYHQVKAPSKSNQSHLDPCSSCADPCTCNSYEPSNLSSVSSSCDSHCQSSHCHIDRVSLPEHHLPYYPEGKTHDDFDGSQLGTHLQRNHPRRKLNPNPNLLFLEKLKADPNTLTAIL